VNDDGVTEKQVLAVLDQVMDPELGQDLVSLGMIEDLVVAGRNVSFTLNLTTPACPLKAELENAARAAVQTLPGVEEVIVNVSARVPWGARPSGKRPIPGVRHIVAVASGKGGVGKTTVAVNLALALAESGAQVGLLDADIYSPNVPLMMSIRQQPVIRDEKLVPATQYGIEVASMGFLAAPEAPILWRGHLVTQMIEQLLRDVEGGELDYLIVDLPPGTGEVQLTLVQEVPLTGAVVVTIPQDVALYDAVKALNMFSEVNVPTLGLVENMSYYVCAHCGKRHSIFREGRTRDVSEQLGVPFLGQIPLHPDICDAGDKGAPIVVAVPDSPQAQAFRDIAQKVAARVSLAALTGVLQEWPMNMHRKAEKSTTYKT
jgi:ATP-binding protein involved in chromosome partitioning